MALPILDGNQSATTLSTILSSGQHITAHTVVSLGTQAVTDISTAVGLLQSAVATQGSIANTAFVKIGGHTGTATTGNIVHVSSVGAMKVDASASTQPISGTVTANIERAVFSSGSGEGAIPNEAVAIGWVEETVAGANFNFASKNNPLPISGTVTANIGNSITVSALPVSLSTTTIGGTARLNVTLSSATTIGATVPSYGNLYGGSDGTNLRAILVDSSGRTTVTGSVSILGTPSVTMGAISGTVTANIASTTVTISAQPSGALTTRFGSVTTANTAGITTAVTNTSRKYLLAQNISTGTVTIGIGFSPTTTQGIQLTSGAGLTFDSFVPTGAVYWLGATTGAAYTILEG